MIFIFEKNENINTCRGQIKLELSKENLTLL